MRLKTRIGSICLLLVGVLVMPLPASGLIVGNTLSLSTASSPAGDTATVSLAFANEDVVGGIQADIIFDGDVAAFNSLAVTGRGAGMTAEGRVVVAGQLRVLLFFDDSSSLPSDEGTLAEVEFTMLGVTDEVTSLVFQDIILSDPAGGSLTGSGLSGQLTVQAPQDPPSMTIAVLKNPGRSRTVRILVTVTGGSGDLPTVNAGSSQVTMTHLGSGVFEGQHFASGSSNSLIVSSSDTNSQGTGNAQVNLTLP